MPPKKKPRHDISGLKNQPKLTTDSPHIMSTPDARPFLFQSRLKRMKLGQTMTDVVGRPGVFFFIFSFYSQLIICCLLYF